MNSNEKELVRAGLVLRDRLGGHHFFQAEPGAGADGKQKLAWICRDCDLRANVDPAVWQQWVVFWLDTPEPVRRVLDRKSCG